jgi:hypothetical protein
MRAVHRDAASLAMVSAQNNQDWARVRKVTAGTEILVELRDGAASRYFVLADDTELVVLDLANAHLTRKVRHALLEMASRHPEKLLGVFAGYRYVYDDVRLAPDGLFQENRKIAEVHEIVERIPQSDIVSILKPPQRRGSWIGMAVGAGLGLLVGKELATRFAFKQCGGGCGDEGFLVVASIIGLPVAGGALGYQARVQTTQEVLYRAHESLIPNR